MLHKHLTFGRKDAQLTPDDMAIQCLILMNQLTLTYVNNEDDDEDDDNKDKNLRIKIFQQF